MAKFTAKFVRDSMDDAFISLAFDDLKVTSKQKTKKSNGKMVEVVDNDATIRAIEGNLLYYRGYLDAMAIFESKFPEGIAELVNDKMAEWEALRAAYEKKFPNEHEAWAEEFVVEPFEDVDAFDSDDDDEEAEEEDEAVDYSELSLSELRAECKDRGIKYTPKDKADALVEKLEAWDAENTEEVGDDDEEAEEEDEETSGYEDMSLGELRKECKAREIKYTPKDKAEALIAKLEAYDEENGEAEDEDDEEEDADEESVDYSELSLGELRKLAKERGIKYSPKTKADELVAALEEYDSENSDDDDEEAEEEDEAVDYSELSLSELRAECKDRGIKYTPKMKADDLIAKLEEDDASGSDDEEDGDTDSGDEDSDDGEEVSEEDLDAILDEEFEDETLEEEESKAPAKGNKGKKLPPKKK